MSYIIIDDEEMDYDEAVEDARYAAAERDADIERDLDEY